MENFCVKVLIGRKEVINFVCNYGTFFGTSGAPSPTVYVFSGRPFRDVWAPPPTIFYISGRPFLKKMQAFLRVLWGAVPNDYLK